MFCERLIYPVFKQRRPVIGFCLKYEPVGDMKDLARIILIEIIRKFVIRGIINVGNICCVFRGMVVFFGVRQA